jgi:hypothetical protein
MRMDKAWWASLSWQAKLLIVMFGASGLFLLSAKLGLITFEGTGQPVRPPFDRRECLSRKQEEFYPGMFADELSDSARSRIAAACAREEYG